MIIEGVLTALVTPMRDGQVDLDALAAHADAQVAAGVHGLVPCGTTGESPTLTADEQRRVIARVVEVAAGRVPVVAGAGANSTAKAIELAKAAEAAGADALLIVTPYYNKPTQDGLYRHYQALAAATRLPIVLYNVPGRTACDLLPETVARLAAIENIVGIKDATGDMRRASELVAGVPPEFRILSGDDFSAMPLFAVGGHGVISVVSNILPGTTAKMWEAVRSGDLATARKCHHQLLPLTALLFAEPSPIPAKAALALMGKIGPEIRPPLYPCSEGLVERLRTHLAKEGLL